MYVSLSKTFLSVQTSITNTYIVIPVPIPSQHVMGPERGTKMDVSVCVTARKFRELLHMYM